MKNVVRINGAPLPTGKAIEDHKHFCIYGDQEGSVEFSQEGLQVWGPLYRNAGIDIASVSHVSELTATLQSVCNALDDETIEILKARHSIEELRPVAKFLDAGHRNKARALLGENHPDNHIKPVD